MEINKPISIIIFTVISLIFIFLFTLPKYQESTALQMRLDEKLAEYNGKSAYFEKISEILRNLEDKKDVVEKINTALPEEFYFSPIVFFLQKKADENGLINKSVTFSQGSSTAARGQTGATNKNIRNVQFTLSEGGSYEGLKNFLLALEKSSRIFEVNTISFASPQSLSSQSALYDFRLEIVTHTY